MGLALLPGCVYTETDLGFPVAGAAKVIPAGYWQVCGIFAGKSEECHVVKNEPGSAGQGTFRGTAGVVSVYSLRWLDDEHFVYQTHLKASLKEAFFYALGHVESDRSVFLSSPDCRFPRPITDEFDAAGLSFSLSLPFLPRSCAARGATADNIVREFAILARHRGWQPDVSRRLVMMTEADGARAFEAEKRAAEAEADGERDTGGLQESEIIAMERGVDRKFVQWASSWRIDKYTSPSVRIARVQCENNSCSALGRFSFGRQGVAYRIPFTAWLERRGQALRVNRLCYDDHSSDASDCIR